MKNVSTKMFALLLLVLGINMLRYGTYLLEDSTNVYNRILFGLNSALFVWVVVLKTKEIPIT